MNTKSLLISGDSWGRGVWRHIDANKDSALKKYFKLLGKQNKPKHIFDEPLSEFICDEFISNNLIHKGLEQYLIDADFTVKNISYPSGSNRLAIKLISAEDLSNFNEIIWFQTDPIRDLRPYESFVDDFVTYQQIIDKQNSLLYSTYYQLNQFNKPIICLGGCSKLNLELIKDFENLVPLVPSIPEFLLDDYKHPEIWVSDWYQLIDRQFSIDNIEKLLYNKKLQDSLNDYPDLFWPDGSHPNKLGCKLIFDYVNNFLKNI